MITSSDNLDRILASTKWPGVYHGVLDVNIGPITNACDGPLVKLEFPKSVQNVASVFIVLSYETVPVPSHHQGITYAGA